MVRKKIEIESGAIFETERLKWEKAKIKLTESIDYLEKMTTSKLRPEFEMFWSRFVDSLQQFLVCLEQEGKKSYNNFQPWIGRVKSVNKKDELLEYLYQVRNQSQHGIVSLSWDNPNIVVGKGFVGTMAAVRVFNDDTYEIDSIPAADSPTEAKVEYCLGNPRLVTFKNKKNGKAYHPPKMHKGKVIQISSPQEAAQLGLEYYNELMKEVENKFC